MKQLGELTSKNYIMYAMKNYDNPQCLDIEEFYSDLNRIKYLKRLFRRYKTTNDLKERLILNHIIIFYNVFGIIPATKLLFFRMEPEFYPLLKTFLVYLSLLPEDDKAKQVFEADLLTVPLDKDIANILRKI